VDSNEELVAKIKWLLDNPSVLRLVEKRSIALMAKEHALSALSSYEPSDFVGMPFDQLRQAHASHNHNHDESPTAIDFLCSALNASLMQLNSHHLETGAASVGLGSEGSVTEIALMWAKYVASMRDVNIFSDLYHQRQLNFKHPHSLGAPPFTASDIDLHVLLGYLQRRFSYTGVAWSIGCDALDAFAEFCSSCF
jgi:hypothetical protein